MPLNIIVVGAGLGGLATAIALRKNGTHTVTVLEKYAAKTEVGFAVTVPPISVKVLRHLGVDYEKAGMSPWTGVNSVRADRTPMEWLEEKNEAESEVLGRAEERYGAPSLAAHRVDLHNALRERCIDLGVEIREKVTVSEYDADEGLVTLQDGERLMADVIVAADGVKSKAHKWVLGEERPAKGSRLRNVRFTLSTESFREIEELMVPNEEAAVAMSVVYAGPKQNIVMLRYSCRGGTLQNFGLYEYAEKDDPTIDEKWRTRTPRQIALSLLEGYNESVKEIIHRTKDDDMYLWHVNERSPLPSYSKGRLVLLGDSAHPMHPTLGAGAAIAFEDAAVLGVLLRDVDAATSVPSRLALYDDLRRPRASATQLLAQSSSMWYNISEENQEMAKKFIPEKDWPSPLTRPNVNDWLFKLDCIADAEKALDQLRRDSAVV